MVKIIDGARMVENKEKAHVQGSDPTFWVEKHGDYLFRYALLRLRNTALAEDVAL